MMTDDEFHDHLDRAAKLLTQQLDGPLPGRADADRAREILSTLEEDPATASDLEREAALDAVYRQLAVVDDLLEPDESDPETGQVALTDGEFYDRLNQAAHLLTRQGRAGPLPRREDVERAGEMLAELERDPATVDNRARQGTLDAVYQQLAHLDKLLQLHESESGR
jgi:hypothetical protein